MAKRSNNSLSRRTYGGKPYDANNSFVKKMATKVTDLIPQRSWISKWFNASQDNVDISNEDGNLMCSDEEIQLPPAKRPRIRMDITHPPGTFSIRSRNKQSSVNHNSQVNNDTEEYFLEPATAGPSGICKFAASTPAVEPDVRIPNSQRSRGLSHVQSGNNGTTNGVDDNSESGESTSGCSSLIPQTNRQEGAPNSDYGSNSGPGRNRFIDDKSSFVNHLQSPRCLFLTGGGSRESLSSRRPSFNASMMSANGSNLDRTSSLSSPFYSGNVTFGGANAIGSYRRSNSLFNSTNEFQLKVPRRTNVQVKPSNVESIDASGMSQTAKRILEAMEYFSSPISDAKKIPVNKLSETTVGRKRLREERASPSGPMTRVGLRHLTRELAVPTVPEMLKLRRRQKLQDTTVAARKIISAKSGPAPSSWSTVASTSAPVTGMFGSGETASSQDYRLRTELDNSSKYQSKLRGKSKTIPEDEGPAPNVNLPSISLPITSLPSFEPLPKYTTPPVTSSLKGLEGNRTGYAFASPIKITESSWNLKSINNFSFSNPINANAPAETSVSHNTSGNTGSGINFMWSGSSTAPRLKVKTKQSEFTIPDVVKSLFDKSPLKEMVKLQSGTKDTDSPTSRSKLNNSLSKLEIWECSECYIKNDSSESVCVACKKSKSSVTKDDYKRVKTIGNENTNGSSQNSENISASPGFGTQFRANANQWKCETCLLLNSISSTKCISCSSPRVNGVAKRSDESLASASKPTVKYDLAEKFKPPEGSWECPGCMLRNPSSVIKCPCCSASKPSLAKVGPKTGTNNETESSGKKENEGEKLSLLDKLKPAAGSWECSSCLVRNNETATSCVCCSGPKPGAAKESAPKFNAEPGWGDKFKKPQGTWTCDSCMVQNKSEATACVACTAAKPGSAPTSQGASPFGVATSASTTFKFGIDPAENSKLTSGSGFTNGFDFAAKSATSNVPPGTFSFGIPKDTGKSAADTATKTPAIGGFVFASPKTAKDSTQKLETSNDTVKEPSTESKNSSITFQFGLPTSVIEKPKSESSTNEKTEKEIGGSFGKTPFVFGVNKADDSSKNESKVKFDVPSEAKATIFGNRSESKIDSNAITQKTTVVNEQSKNVPTSVSNPLINPSETRAPFSFSEAKSPVASQSSTNTLAFGQTSTAASTTSSTTTQSLNSSENTMKPAVPTFGIPSTATSSAGFGLPSSTLSSPATLSETKSCFAPPDKSEKPETNFFGVPEEKKAGTFGAALDKPNPLFGSTENKLPSLFGDKSVASPASSNSMFNSGSSTSTFGNVSTTTSAPVFGSSSAPVFGVSNATPTFGNNNTVGSTSIFGSVTKSNATPAPANNSSLFTFGGANQQVPSQSTPSSFAFPTETGDSSASANKSIFAFGNSSNVSQPNASQVFGSAPTNAGTFGSQPSTATNPSSSPFTFNAPTAKQDPPVFGQTSTAVPNIFGSPSVSAGLPQQAPPPPFPTNPSPTSTGFNFGSSAPSTGSFNFSGGITQPAPAPSGGFNFNAPAPSSTVAFDPNTRPCFNFTGGSAPVAFNALPQPAAPRKIKKAVRRMQQR